MSGRKRSFSPTVRRLVRDAQHGMCKNCLEPLTDFHHRVANSKTNRKLFPRFIHSIFNCLGLCRRCHTQSSYRYHITLDEAMAYESWLSTVWGIVEMYDSWLGNPPKNPGSV